MGVCFAFENHGILESDYIIRYWGDMTDLPDRRFEGELIVKEAFYYEIGLNETFVYRPRDLEKALMTSIVGIKLEEKSTKPAEITFLGGGIGSTFVIINIVTDPGEDINCLFFFSILDPNNAIEPQAENYYELL